MAQERDGREQPAVQPPAAGCHADPAERHGAAAESARNDQIDANAAASGASGRDPSLQGAKAANFAARQVGNQRAAGDIAAKANSANFGAQMDAANTLNQNAMQRAQWAQSGAGAGMPFSPFGSGQGGGGYGNGRSQSFGGYQGLSTGNAIDMLSSGKWAVNRNY